MEFLNSYIPFNIYKQASSTADESLSIKEEGDDDFLVIEKESAEESQLKQQEGVVSIVAQKVLIQQQPENGLEGDEEFEILEKPKDSFNCSVIPSLHSADTEEWRKKMVMAAEHNIVISGNYGGGKAFDELLILIEERMKEVPALQVVLIVHPCFIKNQAKAKINPHENIKLLSKLSKKYPTRFSLVKSPGSYHGAKKITNHTKCTVIDYGKYYIQGGSGIKDNFVLTGTDDITKEEYLEQERGYKLQKTSSGDYYSADDLALKQQTKKAKKSIQDDFNVHLTTLIKGRKEESSGGGLLDLIIPGSFRDQDFIFRCSDEDQESGKKMYQEAIYLAYKWDQHSKRVGLLGKYLPPESLELNDLSFNYKMDDILIQYPALGEWDPTKGEEIEESDSALYRMLKTPLPDLTKIRTKVLKFDGHINRVNDVFVKLYFTGPENNENPFANDMVKKITQAKNNIVIDQMYFQPSNEVMKALIDAAKRGVKITIISAGMTKNAPNSQLFFGPRNRYNYYYLVTSLTEEERENVTVYEYSQRRKGNHKKVTIIDDQIFAGSSNMGYKSLVLMGDHEMNFQTKSQKLVDLTIKKVIKEDINRSVLIEHPEIISYLTMGAAAFHSMGARIWG